MIERLKALHLTLESVLQLVDEGGYHMISWHITRYQCLQLCICNHLCIILYMYIIHVRMYHFPYTCTNINVAIIKVPFQASACVITSYICISYCRD